MEKEEIREIYQEDIDQQLYEQMSRYMDMTKEEFLQIRPIWAIDDRINELENSNHNPEFGGFRVALVSIKDVFANARIGLDTKELFVGEINDSRYATTLERWEAGLAVDPPTLTLSADKFTKLSVSDGRHRTVLSHILQEDKIPFFIPTHCYDEVAKVLKLDL